MIRSPVREFSLYYLDEAGSATGGNCSAPFSATCYSRYKYGSVRATEVSVLNADRASHGPGPAYDRQRIVVRPVPAQIRRAARTNAAAQRADLPHIAAFDGSSGQYVDPVLEDVLNHAVVKTLGDLAAIVRAADFTWNIRAVSSCSIRPTAMTCCIPGGDA